MSDHIVKSYDEELARLDDRIGLMAGMVESQFSEALNAIQRRDSAIAEAVLAKDVRVDQLNQEIDALVVRLLALRQPLAIDLRTVVGTLRTASELERIGDYAANIGKRALAVNQSAMVQPIEMIVRMGRLVVVILKEVIDAFAHRDAARAEIAWRRDSEVDELYSSLFHEILLLMADDPGHITTLTHTLFMAKNIERIGDHATNIAETVHFMVYGTPLRDERPKRDRTSFFEEGAVRRTATVLDQKLSQPDVR